MPKLFAVSIVLILLLGAGYGALQAARSIPWNCDDWQPFAHADRTTAILETLAENRGKTLYCGIDQSDTFAKAETWEAGRDRNERDDTVYWGERGSFRGFIAAQEGWLTEGESGITGQSIATIFEFPKEERKRRRKKYKPNLVYDREYPDSTLSVPGITANNPNGPTTGYLVINPRIFETPQPPGITTYIRGPRTNRNGFVRAYGPAADHSSQLTAQANARSAYRPPTTAQAAEWARNGNGDTPNDLREVPGGATEECMALGYNRATRVRWWYYDGDGDGTPNLFVTIDLDPGSGYRIRAYREILYTALCRN